MKLVHIMFFTLFIFTLSFGQAAHSVRAGEEDKPLIFVEQQPVFPGGDVAMVKFIQQHVNYPDEARNDSIQGKVVVRFAIDTDGSVTEVSINKSVNHVFDKEAIRVIKLLPKFKPGYAEGKPVKVYFNFPFVFRL